MTVTLKSKKPIVVPNAIRRKAGLRSGDEVEFEVSGRVIKIVPKKRPKGYASEEVQGIIQEAKERPLSRRALAALNAQVLAYGARQAKKAPFKEGEIPGLIHASRSRQPAP